MKLLDLRAFEGPSVYSDAPCVHVSCEWPERALGRREFEQRLAQALPHQEGWSRDAARVAKLLQGVDPVTADVAVGALAAGLIDEHLGRQPGYAVLDGSVVVDAPETAAAAMSCRMGVDLARELFNDAWPQDADRTERLTDLRRRYQKIRESVRLDFTTRMILEAARSHRIPAHVAPSFGNMLLLGHGRRRRRMVVGVSDQTSALAVRLIARDKVLTLDVLKRGGIPTPRQFLVSNQDDMRTAIEALGFPLVIKGRTVDKGVAVTTDVMSMQDVRRGMEKVRQHNSDIIFEQQIEGADARFTVVGGRLVAAAQREAAHVVGDGRSTVEQLIKAANAERFARGGYANWLTPLKLDDDSRSVMAGQGVTAGTMPGENQVVRLRSAANISQGGTSIDITDDVCPDVRISVERAARLVGLDVAGVDVRAPSFSAPLEDTGGAVLEVNSFAALRVHYLAPTPPRDVAGAVVRHHFARSEDSHIPIIVVVGAWGGDAIDALIARTAGANYVFAAAKAGCARIGGEIVKVDGWTAHVAAEAALADPRVDAVAVHVTPQDLIARGLPWGGCAAAVIQTEPSLEAADLAALTFLARHAERNVVLGGSGPHRAEIAEAAQANVTIAADADAAVQALEPLFAEKS